MVQDFKVGSISDIVNKTGKKFKKNKKPKAEQDTNETEIENVTETLNDSSVQKAGKNPKKRKAKEIATNETEIENVTETLNDSTVQKAGKNSIKRKAKEIATNENEEAGDQTVNDQKGPKNKNKKVKKEIKSTKDEVSNEDESNEVLSEKLSRTLFVGNLPSNFAMKNLKKTLQEFGKVKSIRVRNVAPSKISLSKKAAFLSKQINPNKKTVNAYIVFQTIDSVEKALSLNGTEFEGNIIQTDKVEMNPSYDNSTSVFLGNLSFKTTDDELREYFKDCGEIKSVRLVRDARTGIGKGFGYVNFESKDGVVLALQKNQQTFKGREIRVKIYKYGGQKDNKKPLSFKSNSPNKKGARLEKPTSSPLVSKDTTKTIKPKNFAKKANNPEGKQFKGEVATKKKFVKKTLKNRIKSSKVKKQKKVISEILSK